MWNGVSLPTTRLWCTEGAVICDVYGAYSTGSVIVGGMVLDRDRWSSVVVITATHHAGAGTWWLILGLGIR